jgi:DNA-binding CsgD family transcriptional regulator
MPTYQIVTQLFSGEKELSFNKCFIDEISPSRAMRKYNLPKLKPDQKITIEITPVAVDSEIVSEDSQRSTNLTDREIEVLYLVAADFSKKEIALSLNISEKSVNNHITAILAKLETLSLQDLKKLEAKMKSYEIRQAQDKIASKN